MKKYIVIGALSLFSISSQGQKAERTYKAEIPESLIGTFWMWVQGKEDDLSVKEYKNNMPRLSQSLINQIQKQAQEFAHADSLAKKQTDSLKIAPKKPLVIDSSKLGKQLFLRKKK